MSGLVAPKSVRSSRRRAALGVLDDSEESSASTLSSSTSSTRSSSSHSSPPSSRSSTSSKPTNADSDSTPSSPPSNKTTTQQQAPSSSIKSRKGRRESKAAFEQSKNSGKSDAKDSLDDLDGTNLSHVMSYIEDLQDEVKTRCDSIRATAEESVMSLRSLLQVSLMKLPRSIRLLPLTEFESKYGGDVIGAIRRGIEEETELEIGRGNAINNNNMKRKADENSTNNNAPPSTPSGSSSRSVRSSARKCKAAAAETPRKGDNGNGGGIPQTPATVRAVRRGEVILSANGSPLVSEERGKRKKVETDGKGVGGMDLEMDASSILSQYKKAGVGSMDEDMKKTAVNKLKSLQDEVAALMAQLGSC